MAKRYASRVRVNGKQVREAHVLWNKRHPNDPVLPGEVVHHKDENKKNDTSDSHEKMTDTEHRRHHASKDRLRDWAKENPKLARKQSQESVKKLHKFMSENPEVEQERKRKCREHIIVLNKSRRGEKRSDNFRRKQRESMKEVWRKRKGGDAL
jgi:type IV secretory pathway VirB4 component